MKVIIDGVEYVPRADVPPITDQTQLECLRSLIEIQYFREQTHKHRAWAWDALNALSPELAQLAAESPQAAWNRVHPDADT